jgi:hypothetical protein
VTDAPEDPLHPFSEMMNGPVLPGVLIRWVKRARGRYRLVRDDGTVVADVQRRVGSLRSVKVGDRAYRARYKRRQWLYWPQRYVRAVEDISTGRVVLTIQGVHFNHKDDSLIKLADGRTLTFPVEGTYAEMQAFDENGKSLMRFRPAESGPWMRNGLLLSRPIEVVVSPEEALTDDVVLVIAVASPFLRQYLRTTSTGTSIGA